MKILREEILKILREKILTLGGLSTPFSFSFSSTTCFSFESFSSSSRDSDLGGLVMRLIMTAVSVISILQKL